LTWVKSDVPIQYLQVAWEWEWVQVLYKRDPGNSTNLDEKMTVHEQPEIPYVGDGWGKGWNERMKVHLLQILISYFCLVYMHLNLVHLDQHTQGTHWESCLCAYYVWKWAAKKDRVNLEFLYINQITKHSVSTHSNNESNVAVNHGSHRDCWQGTWNQQFVHVRRASWFFTQTPDLDLNQYWPHPT
jgi:hypothetical protein